MKPKEAVERTLVMWEWLAENPTKEKSDYLKTIPKEI